MTPSELAELSRDISLEKWILDESLLAHPASTQDAIDLRGPNAIIGASCSDSLAGSAVTEFRDKVLLPLLFGTSWKLVDLIVERAWQAQGGPPKPQIAQKVQRTVSNPTEIAAVIGCDQCILDRIMAVYRNTSQLRHALLHRRVSRSDDGGLVGDFGQRLTKDEILALCKLSRRLPEGIGAAIDLRTRGELAWHLNRLPRVHGQGELPDAYAPRTIDVVLVSAMESDGVWVVDIDRAKHKARSVNGGFPCADLQVFLPSQSTPVVECRLEDAPDGGQVPLDAIARRQMGNGGIA
jgi:hypothetical protein